MQRCRPAAATQFCVVCTGALGHLGGKKIPKKRWARQLCTETSLSVLRKPPRWHLLHCCMAASCLLLLLLLLLLACCVLLPASCSLLQAHLAHERYRNAWEKKNRYLDLGVWDWFASSADQPLHFTWADLEPYRIALPAWMHHPIPIHLFLETYNTLSRPRPAPRRGPRCPRMTPCSAGLTHI